MKRKQFYAAAIVALALVVGMTSAETVERKGRYIWNVGDRGKLNVIFESTADPNLWDVSIKFKFQGQRYTYAGQAKGNPNEGALAATVTSEKGIDYRFEGTTEAGLFNGTHYQGKRETGSLSFR